MRIFIVQAPDGREPLAGPRQLLLPSLQLSLTTEAIADMPERHRVAQGMSGHLLEQSLRSIAGSCTRETDHQHRAALDCSLEPRGIVSATINQNVGTAAA